MDLATLGIRIDSNGVVKATGDLKGMEGQAKRSEDSVDGLSRAFRMLAPLVGTVMAAFSIRALTGYADAWSDMQSRVGAAVKNMEAAPALMERLVDVANASYSPLAQTVEIYGRNVAVLRDLGRGATEAADFTEALNHALVTTATKGQDADVVLNALSRAISTGKLRAMEYETIMSRSPRVLEAVADAMGTTVTGLRQMAVDGKVTGGVIVDALIGSLEQLREEAGEMPATVGDALVRIQTNFGALVGRVDQATGASEDFAITLIGLADSIRNMTDDVVRSAVVVQTIFGSALDGVTGLVASLGVEFDGMATLIIAGAGAAGFAITTLGFITLRTMAMITGALMANPFALLVAGIAMAATAAFVFRDELKQILGVDFVGDAKDAVNVVIGFFVGGYNAIVDLWQNLPQVFSGIGKMAWNSFIAEFEKPALVINGVEVIPGLNLSGMKATLSQGEQNALSQGIATFREGFDRDYIGGIGNALGEAWDNAAGASSAISDMDTSLASLASTAGGSGGATAQLNAYQQATQAVLGNIAALEQQALAFGLSETAATRFNTAMDLLRAAQEAGIPITGALIDEINRYADATANATSHVKLLQEQQQMMTQAANMTANALTGMFESAIIGGKDFGEIIRNLLLDLGRMFANAGFQALLGGFGSMGGGGGLLGGMIIPGILHRGGVAGSDGYGHGRAFAASTWDNAVRYHTGGIAGLRPNEVPAILERGEIILPANSNVAPQQVNVHVTLGWSQDADGNITPYVESVAQRTVGAAAPAIVGTSVGQANKSAPAAVAGYQRQRAGGDWRNM